MTRSREQRRWKGVALGIASVLALILVAIAATVLPSGGDDPLKPRVSPVVSVSPPIATLAPSVTAPPGWEPDTVLRRLMDAHYAVSIPTPLEVNRTTSVTAKVSTALTERDLLKSMTDAGTRLSGPVRVSPRVSAILTGPRHLNIAPASSPTQVVGSGETTWVWQLTPSEAGEFEVVIEFIAHVSVEGTAAEKSVRSLTRPLNVEIRLAQALQGLLAENWQWAITSSAALAGVFLGWARVRKRKPAGFRRA